MEECVQRAIETACDKALPPAKVENKETFELKNIDPDDIGDVLQKVEKSFGFRFGANDLKGATTFGELCDLVTLKVAGHQCDDCTTQQAFYKLRHALALANPAAKNYIKPDLLLEQFLPYKTRRQKIKVINVQLGFKTKILRPKKWVITTLFFLILVSLAGFYLSLIAGLAGIALSLMLYTLAYKFGRNVVPITIGELSKKFAREHYKDVRRDSATINRNEIQRKITELFVADLGIEEDILKREATFD